MLRLHLPQNQIAIVCVRQELAAGVTRCRNGPCTEGAVKVAVPRGNGVTTLSRPQASEMEDSRGALCRNRRLFGTLEHLRCGWARQDREGGKGRERAGSSCLFLQGTWRSGESDWA